VGMALDEPDDDETPVTVNGIGVLVSEPVQPYVKGTIIDYIVEPQGEGFVLKGRKNNC
jgi:Fe-S cluster assembly iron-binding protein IscA